MAKQRGGQRMLSGREITYDPKTSTEPWRPPASFQPAQAEKLIGAMRSIHPRLSVGGFLDVVIRLLPTSESDAPLTWAALEKAVRAQLPAVEPSPGKKGDGNEPLQEALIE